MRNFFHGRRSIAVAIFFAGTAGTLAVPVIVQATRNDGSSAKTTDTSVENRTEKRAASPTSDQTNNQDSSHQSANSTSGSAGNGSNSSVTVNGQTIPVPENGSYKQVTDNGTSRMEISVESRQQGGASSSSNTSLHLNVTSESSSGDQP